MNYSNKELRLLQIVEDNLPSDHNEIFHRPENCDHWHKVALRQWITNNMQGRQRTVIISIMDGTTYRAICGDLGISIGEVARLKEIVLATCAAHKDEIEHLAQHLRRKECEK